jgi:hypothetical protein
MLHIKHTKIEHRTHSLISWTQQFFVSHTNSNMLDSELNNVHLTPTVTSVYSPLYSAPKA